MNLMPFLLFEGDCADAMRFYQSCLDGDLEIVLLRDTPMKDQAPEHLHDKVAYSRLTSGLVDISATDWQHQTRTPRQGNTIGLYLTSDSFGELEAAFGKLAVGADPDLLDELRDMPFGAYGHLCDRFGVNWFFRGEPAP
ncbi:MAG TPA: VOC family protein [Frankiaceae bacterium]|jgi:PhnB protein|nr:VOC family protein [Frankiaceae bacterium]